MRDRGDFFDLDAVWTPAAAAWYERSIEQCLCSYCDNPDNPRWCHKLLRRPGAIAWLTKWFVQRRERFVVWINKADFHPDREANGVWRLREKRISNALSNEASDQCKDALAGADEQAQNYTLDTWLHALHRGELSRGPKEPGAVELLPTDQQEDFLDRMRGRHRQWPKRCCDCSKSFRPERMNQVRCRKCINARRRATRWVFCKDCECRFHAHHHLVTRCPECRAKWLAEKEVT